MSNRIMDLQEIPGHVGPIYYQQRYCRFSDCVIYQHEHIPDFVFRVITPYKSDRHIKARTDVYGMDWRCWLHRPDWDELAVPFRKEVAE